MSKNNHGFSQDQLREIYIDEGTPYIQMPDGTVLVIKCQGPCEWVTPATIFYVEVESKKPRREMTSRERFNEYFEDETGWGPSDHPDKRYVEALWDAWCAGRDSVEV